MLVVSPALNSPLKHWVSDEDGARAAAAERLQQSLVRLRALGVNAEGEVGDADPLQAIEDALTDLRRGRDHHLDASGRPLALARAWGRRVRPRALSPPITHVVVDLAAEREKSKPSKVRLRHDDFDGNR